MGTKALFRHHMEFIENLCRLEKQKCFSLKNPTELPGKPIAEKKNSGKKAGFFLSPIPCVKLLI